MQERIKLLRKKELRKTQKEFAVDLGLSENFIWQIEKGERTPSDRTISDICRIYNVNEDWLRYGLEPMRSARSEEEQIAEMVASALNGSSKLKKAVVRMICSKSEAELKALEDMLRELYESIK